MEMNLPSQLNLRVLIYKESKSEKWAAQCLEYDIAAQGDSLQDVKNRFARTLVGNIVLGLEHNEQLLWNFLPAPNKFAEMWNEALDLRESYTVFIPSDQLPKNILKFPERVPRGEAQFRIAA
jgi:hypothetical protein